MLKRGGGVLIAVRNTYSSEIIDVNLLDNIEFIAVLIKSLNGNLFVTCSYVPPASEVELYVSHVNAIERIVSFSHNNDSLVVLGDFNLPFISWFSLPDCPSLTPETPNDWSADIMKNFADLDLQQINANFNSLNRILDLVYVDDSTKYEIFRTDPLTFPEDTYHPTLEIILQNFYTNSSVISPANKMSYCFKKTNYVKLKNFLSNVDWEGIFRDIGDNQKLDNSINIFYKTFFECIHKSVPQVCHNHGKIKKIPWHSKELSVLKNLKNRAYKKFRKSGSTIDFASFSSTRSKYYMCSKNNYMKYLDNMKLKFRSDPKSFYSFVNLKRKRAMFPSVVKYKNQEFCDDISISEAFLQFFASTYSSVEFDDKTVYPYNIPNVPNVMVSSIDMSKINSNLKKLKLTYNSGPDGIPNCILKYCADELTKPLYILFNCSLQLGYFPYLWKKSFIIPLHKSGSLSSVTNYRGIAKLSSIPKVFEKMVTDYFTFQVSSIISPFQHGFTKSRSTITNLIEFSSNVIEGFDKGFQTDVIYTDFSKAFDKVNHKLLLLKLELMGVNINFLNWIKSYISDRKQCVLFKNCLSNFISVPSGVPQGSHLGPILFLLFINDLPLCINNSNLLMYADDVKLFLSSNNINLCKDLQDDLNGFYKWCHRNVMTLNLSKCKVMTYSRKIPCIFDYGIGDNPLTRVNSILDLGLLLDDKLNFNSHIITMVNKAYGVLGFLKRWAKEFADPYITKNLYVALVRPILEYGSVVWDPIYNNYASMIESVQKQFLIFCLRNLGWNNSVNLPSYESRLALIKLPSLQSRRTMLNIIFISKTIMGDVDSTFIISKLTFNIPTRPTRYYNLLFIPTCRTNYSNADPLRKMSRDFNRMYHFLDLTLNYDSIKSTLITALNNTNVNNLYLTR